MSLFAGAFYFDRRPVPDWLRTSIASAITRRPGDHPVGLVQPGLFVAFLDVGSLQGDPWFRAGDGAFTVLAGDPILNVPNRAVTRTRAEDVVLIHEDLAASHSGHLATCRGEFAAIHYHPSRHRLALVTDKSAIRPVFCYADEEKIIFCSSLRIFEAMHLPNLRLDLVGVGIALAAHCILGPTLPFERCWRLGAGEVLSCERAGLEWRRYWRWADIGPKEQTDQRALHRAAGLLRESVRLRLRADRRANLLLSGGLDSRVIAACLLDEGVAVDACTLGTEGTADLAFARLYAAAAGLTLREQPIPREEFFSPAPYAAAAFGKAEESGPTRVWNGFDGSFQIGHTFHYDPFIPALREGRLREVTELFAGKKGYGWGGCRRLLREPWASAVESSLSDMLVRYFEDEAPPDKGRTIYVYQTEIGNPPLLQTEFEDLDLHRVEYLTPLADFTLVEHMMTIDPEVCQRHRFYYRMLDYLPPGIKAVPWQSYPTSDPCPVPGPVFAETQWARTPAWWAAMHRRGMAAIPKILRGGIPGHIIRRSNLIVACALHAARLRSYTYHFERVLQLQALLHMTEASDITRR